MIKIHFALLLALVYPSIAAASFFEFFGNQFSQETPQQSIEDKILNANCPGYMCADTFTCVNSPADCPCQFPTSQLKCVLPGGEYICISKPAGDFGGVYDGENAASVDAKDDKVRDCGWVKRIYDEPTL